ncbi:hypothetical protein BLNAU_17901 [Blattamonas nauphoetae]|uniref:Uncharacterized protein n=1 Tax=Blattamonas nauphoetae TaxID=2049346 RepID=A0ABQ9X5Y8_9EUKA|nr:hypothetical protein BLNAU_17901 [Blattamonas nauphoetae]
MALADSPTFLQELSELIERFTSSNLELPAIREQILGDIIRLSERYPQIENEDQLTIFNTNLVSLLTDELLRIQPSKIQKMSFQILVWILQTTQPLPEDLDESNIVTLFTSLLETNHLECIFQAFRGLCLLISPGATQYSFRTCKDLLLDLNFLRCASRARDKVPTDIIDKICINFLWLLFQGILESDDILLFPFLKQHAGEDEDPAIRRKVHSLLALPLTTIDNIEPVHSSGLNSIEFTESELNSDIMPTLSSEERALIEAMSSEDFLTFGTSDQTRSLIEDNKHALDEYKAARTALLLELNKTEKLISDIVLSGSTQPTQLKDPSPSLEEIRQSFLLDEAELLDNVGKRRENT